MTMKSNIKFWILITVITAVSAAYFLFVFLPVKKEIDQMQAETVQTDQEIDFAIRRIRQIPDMRDRRDQSARTVENLRKRLISPNAISSAMSQLNRLTAVYQVKIKTMNFSTDSLLAKTRLAGSGESFELPVLFEFEGRFLDIGMMLEKVNRLPFIISFTDFKMVPQNKSDHVKLDARASIRIAGTKQLKAK